MAACEGNRAKAAEVLGMNKESLASRIQRNRQLRAIWGKGEDRSISGPTPPTQGETLDRAPAEGLPEEGPDDIQLVSMVSAAEKLIHQKGLKKLGISEEMRKNLRHLDSLSSSSGMFLAHGLETTQRLYYVQLLKLMELADGLHKRLNLPKGAEGYISDDEARAFLNKNYIEMVKESGRGFELFMTGTQAMVKMMLDSRKADSPGPGKPAWGRVKK